MNKGEQVMPTHPVVSQEEWLAARKQLLAREKELTRLRDRLHAERQRLPWTKVDKEYVFDGPAGQQTLAELFDGRSQLIVKHFMMGPGWEEGCVGCSFSSDLVDGALVHLEHHDVSYVAVSRAPLSEIETFKRRMGWRFRWVSSFGSDFNYDYHVSFTDAERASGSIYYNYEMRPIDMDELSGLSVFFKDEAGTVFHTYSTYARGTDLLTGVYNFLDITPKGRNEPIRGNLSEWVRHHDRYNSGGFVAPTGRYVSDSGNEDCCRAG
jgi:predicted dithiol-disulfide oxidoreductase (DUF899 family)